MKEKRKKCFANGVVYALETSDGFPIEVTDTFLPFYTKDAIGRRQNFLKNGDLGDRSQRWMIGASTMSGCPVRCLFCATGKLPKFRNLTSEEIVQQVLFILQKNNECVPVNSQEFKINYTRMGEPFLNIEAVKEAIEQIDIMIPTKVHHYVSTIGLKGSDFSWIKDNITLQISLHSLDENHRKELIPISGLMTIEELGQIRTESNQLTTLNMTLVNESDFDINKLKEYFDPEHFFIKLSPVNENEISDMNQVGKGFVVAENIL